MADDLKGIHAGENSAYAAVARWLMQVKSIYGRPLVDARDADFRMQFDDMTYKERLALKLEGQQANAQQNVQAHIAVMHKENNATASTVKESPKK